MTEPDAAMRRLRRWALLGAALYLLAAAADARLTWSGLRGAVALEGNPFLRATMARLGVGWALALEKGAVGLGAWWIATRGALAIHRSEPWIWKVPMLPPVRRWMKAGDRAWIALAPLYGVAAAQAAAAALWLSLR